MVLGVIAIILFILGLDLALVMRTAAYKAFDENRKVEGSRPVGEFVDMPTELQRMKELQLSTFTYGIYNTAEIARLKMLITGEDSRVNSILKSELAFQYLAAGYPDSTIIMIDKLNNGSKINLWYTIFFQKVIYHMMGGKDMFRKAWDAPNRQKGLCYLRMGEQQNCQMNHNNESCIMPFTSKAVHRDKTGSQMAIEYFMKDLKKNPDLSYTKWLLNIAHLTLGQYPDSVPEEHFIRFQAYEFGDSVMGVGKFENVAMQLGVNYNGYYGASIIEDFNNDGNLDIFATSGSNDHPAAMYYGDGVGNWSETQKLAFSNILGGGHAVQGDFNNDGYLDIYMMRGGWLRGNIHPNSLLVNNGDGTFIDVTAQAGLLEYAPSHTAAWFDYNMDGYLDLFVGNEKEYCHLYLNEKDGSFKEVSEQAGIRLHEWVKASFAADFNNDALPDLYVSSYDGKNHLFMNRGKNESGDYYFEDIAKRAGVEKPILSFPVAVFDFNNDGWQDIFCAAYTIDMEPYADDFMGKDVDFERSALYINQGNETFDRWDISGLDRSILAMGLNFGDVDNDGYEDLYIGTGFPQYDALVPNLLLRNYYGSDLHDITYHSGVGHLQKGHGIAFGDLDRDGDRDIYASFGGFFQADNFDNALFLNPGNENNWVRLKLEGTKSNRSAIGARVTLRVNSANGDKIIHRAVNSGGSYGSSTLMLEIGVGKAEKIKELKVFWPVSSTYQTFNDVPTNKAYKLVERINTLQEMEYLPIEIKAKEMPAGHHHHH